MNILITGGLGFIGSRLAEHISKYNNIYILDFVPPAKKSATYKKLYKADIRNISEVKKVCKDIDAIIHLAAKSTPGDISNVDKFYDINIRGTINLLEAARTSGIKKFIFASSSSVYGNAPKPQKEEMPCMPNSFYGASKLTCENLCMLYGNLYGMDVAIPRFFTIYGPKGRSDMAVSRFIENIYSGKEIVIHGHGKIKKDFIHVSDVVESINRMLSTKSAGIVNIGTGRSIELNYLVKLIESELKKKGKTSYIEKQKWDMDTEADIEKARKTLKWEPKITVESGIKDTVKWWLSEAKPKL